MRSHNDMMRSVYPKLMLEGGPQQSGTFGGVPTTNNGHAPQMAGGGAYGMDPRYSTMNGQLVMDPRYASLAATGGGGTNGPMMPQSASGMPRPPLARAVHLTLGVAVLGRYECLSKQIFPSFIQSQKCRGKKAEH